MSRKPIPQKLQEKVLIKCRRRCCMCFFLNTDLGEKDGQIAHLDRNSSNNDVDNLVWLCLNHHNIYDSRPSQSKGFQPGEVKEHRHQLERFLENHQPGEHSNVEYTQAKTSKYLVGKRLKQLRRELGVSSSEMVKLIQYQSEKEYLSMENDGLECPIKVVHKIHVATGVRENWLVHGTLPMADPLFLGWHQDPISAARSIAEIQPMFVFLSIATPTLRAGLPAISALRDIPFRIYNCFLHTGLIVQEKPHIYKVYDLYQSLDFGNNTINDQLISPYYSFLSQLMALFADFNFRTLPISSVNNYQDLFNGNIHPEKIIRKNWNRGGFVYDVFGKTNIWNTDITNNRLYHPWVYRARSYMASRLHMDDYPDPN